MEEDDACRHVLRPDLYPELLIIEPQRRDEPRLQHRRKSACATRFADRSFGLAARRNGLAEAPTRWWLFSVAHAEK